MATEIVRYDKESAFRAQCATTILAGQLVGFDSSGNLVLADADAATPVEAVGFALVGGVSGDKIGVCTQGELYDATWTWTPGAKVWTSGTPGGYVATKVSTATNMIQPVGWAKAATRLIVNVVPALAVVQAAGNSTVAFA